MQKRQRCSLKICHVISSLGIPSLWHITQRPVVNGRWGRGFRIRPGHWTSALILTIGNIRKITFFLLKGFSPFKENLEYLHFRESQRELQWNGSRTLMRYMTSLHDFHQLKEEPEGSPRWGLRQHFSLHARKGKSNKNNPSYTVPKDSLALWHFSIYSEPLAWCFLVI